MQIWLTLRQTEHTQRHPTDAGHVSLLTLGLMAGSDAFLCLLLLTTALVMPQMAVSLSAAALVQFISHSVIGTRHAIHSQRAQRDSFRRNPYSGFVYPSLYMGLFALLCLGG